MKWTMILVAGLIFCGCASTKNSLTYKNDLAAGKRKGEYFYLEAQKQKLLMNNDAVFDLLQKTIAVDSTNSAAHYELANYYLGLGRPESAVSELEKARSYDPDNFWYGMSMANLYQRLQETQKAIEVYEYLLSVNPSTPEIYYAISEAYVMDNRLEDAVKALDKTEERVGVIETLSKQKYQLYMAMEEPEHAYDELKALVAAYPNNMQYRILLGSVYVENDMLEEAKAVYDEAKKLNSSDAYLFIALSDYYNRTGDKEASIKLMKEALINEELDVYTKIQILTDYLKTLVYRNESLEDTDELFQTIIDQHPQEAEVRSLYAEVLNRNEKRGAAIEQLEYAVAFNPNEEKYWNSLGHAYLSAGEWEKLVDVTSKAKEYFPASPFIYFYKGIAYQNLNQNEKAREVYEEAIKNIDQKDVNTISTFYGQVGDVWYQLNDMDKAYEAYDKALDFNKNNILVLNNYAYFLSLDKRDLDKAERMAAMAVKLEPENPTYLDTYAWVFFQQGNYTLAKFYLDSAIQKGGDKDADVMEHYGDILFMQGDKDQAIEYWKKALEMGSDNDVLKMKIKHKSYIVK